MTHGSQPPELRLLVSVESERLARYRRKYRSQPTEQLHLRLLRGRRRRDAAIAIQEELREREMLLNRQERHISGPVRARHK